MYKPSPSHQLILDTLTEKNRKGFAIGGGIIQGKNYGTREGFFEPKKVDSSKGEYSVRFPYKKDYGNPRFRGTQFGTEEEIKQLIKDRAVAADKSYKEGVTKAAQIAKEKAEADIKKTIDSFIEQGDYENFRTKPYKSQLQRKLPSGELRQSKGGRVNPKTFQYIRDMLDAGDYENLSRITGRSKEELISFNEKLPERGAVDIKLRAQRAGESNPRILTDEQRRERGRTVYATRRESESKAKKYASKQDLKDFSKIKKQRIKLNNYFAENPNAINNTEFGKEIKKLMDIRLDKEGNLFYDTRPDSYYIEKAKNKDIFDVFDITPIKSKKQSTRFPVNLNITPKQFNGAFIEGQVDRYFKKGGRFEGNQEILNKVSNFLKQKGIRVELTDVGRIGAPPGVGVERKTGKFPTIYNTLKKMKIPDELLSDINPAKKDKKTNVLQALKNITNQDKDVQDVIKNISEKTNVPIEEVGKDLTNVQKVIGKMQNQMNSGMDPKLLIEYLGAEVKDLAAFGQKYGGDALGKIGKTVAGIDLPIFQVMFGSMYDIEQDSPLWLTIPAAFTDEVANLYGLYNKSEGRFGLGKAKDFGKFVASSFVPRFLRSPIFKTVSKVGKIGTMAGPLLEAGAEAYRFEKMKDARDEAIRQFKIPEEKGIKGFENYIRSTIPQDLAGQGFDELTVPDSPGLPKLIRDLKEIGAFLNLNDDPYEIKKIRGDVTGTGLTSPMALQRLYDRQGLVEGGPPDKNRRMILKMLGLIPAGIAGLASLRFGPKKVKKVIDAIKTTEIPGKPEWFDSLVNKVIRLGEDVSKKFATQDRQVVHRVILDKDGNVIDANQADKIRQEGNPYDVEDITVTRNLDDGEIRVTYYSDENMGAGDVDLVYKPGRADEYTKGTPPDTFEAVEAEPRAVNMDGDIEYDGENLVQNIDDLYSDTNKLKQFATDQKPTMKEFVESKKKKAIVKEVNESDVGATEYLSNKYGEPIYDLPDEDPPYPFASGGIANFFKKR